MSTGSISLPGLALLACGALQAQTPPAGRSVEAVRAEAIEAAHAPDQNGAAGTRGFGAFSSSADPQQVRQGALEQASNPDQNGAASTRGFGDYKGAADPDAIAAEARGAATAPDQNVSSGSKVNSQVISTMPARAPQTAGK
jgi:hypothetical protein